MRSGAEFMISPQVNKTNMNAIVKRLERCSNKNNACRKCPDLKACADAYDVRCSYQNKKKKQKKKAGAIPPIENYHFNPSAYTLLKC